MGKKSCDKFSAEIDFELYGFYMSPGEGWEGNCIKSWREELWSKAGMAWGSCQL